MTKWTVNKLKSMYDTLLRNKLVGVLTHVIASYVMSRDAFVFDVNNIGNRIYLRINLALTRQLLESDILPEKVSMNYLANYIAEYIKTIGESHYIIPDSYAKGVAIIDALYTTYISGRQKVFSSIISHIVSRNRKIIRTIDVLCEANALIKTKVQLNKYMTAEVKEYIDKIIENLMLNVNLPEMVKMNSIQSMMTIRYTLKELKDLYKCNDFQNNVPGFLNGICLDNDDIFVESLIDSYKSSKNNFLLGLLTRIAANTHMFNELIKEQNVEQDICYCANEYQKQIVFYLQNGDRYDFYAKSVLRTGLKQIKEINKCLEEFEWRLKVQTAHMVI